MVQRTKQRLRHARKGMVLVVVSAMMLIGPLVALAGSPANSGFLIDGIVPDAGLITPTLFGDDSGNTKELGPLNSNTTKLGVIHNDVPPTLGLSNPNGQVDLVNVWFASNSADGTDWLYFAWQRDSTNGSGVIAIEFQQDAAPLACDYEGAEADLIANCNPWANRQEGDFILIWDQVGNDIQISIRTFDGTVFGAPVVLDQDQAAAELSPDTSRGEAVVDLGVIFPPEPTECLSIANVIPGTITGNSDSADYKDTVLADIAGAIRISNCGSLELLKTDDDGQALAGAVFTLYESDGDDSFEPGGDDPVAQDPDGFDQTCTTGVDGKCSIGDIFFGDYWIDETTVPANHDKATGLPAEVTISSKTTVDLGTFVNPRQRGSIIIEKVIDGTTTRVDGAGFSLDVDGDPSTTGDQTAIPGVTGQTGLFCLDNLLFDDYTVVETTIPPGYEAVTLSQTHTVNSKSDCTTRLASPTPDLTFENTKVTSLVTTANQQVIIGNFISDTATLSDGVSPTGSIAFALYDNATCAGDAIYTDSKPVTGNGAYTTSYRPEAPGVYYWLASYSGDESNKASSHACAVTGEVDTVIKATPTLTTSADETVTIGSPISDKATLSGGYQPVTGTVTFRLYSDDQCTSLVTEKVETIAGGSAGPVSFAPTTPGIYYWIATYSGDVNNNGVVGSCQDSGEVDTVIKASPSLSTTPKLLPNDSATLSGGYGNLTGTLSFELYNNATCSGSNIYSEDLTVNGTGTYQTTNTTLFVTADGTYSWLVTYTGDGNNEQAYSICTAEQMVIDFTPLLP